ncbi:hypothetical protein TWF696_008585 [Orbilia brochopaga]|uniref:Subtilisin n=1 Tax=Orbilia brochopaga TaxID=3140254 RepID=A0AAV9UG76_9PEZI
MARLSQMSNVAVVASTIENYPLNDYIAALSSDDTKYPNLIAAGSVPIRREGLELRGWQSKGYVKAWVPESGDMMIANPGFGGGYTTVSTGQGLSAYPAAIVSGVLATFISAHRDSAAEAKARLYRLAYPRHNGIGTDFPEDYPPVVYNGFEPVNFEQSAEKSKHCRNQSRGLLDTGARDECEDTASPTANAKTSVIVASAPSAATPIPMESPLSIANYVYNAMFCKLCLKADGIVPVDGVVWIPADCPCRSEDRASGN